MYIQFIRIKYGFNMCNVWGFIKKTIFFSSWLAYKWKYLLVKEYFLVAATAMQEMQTKLCKWE